MVDFSRYVGEQRDFLSSILSAQVPFKRKVGAIRRLAQTSPLLAVPANLQIHFFTNGFSGRIMWDLGMRAVGVKSSLVGKLLFKRCPDPFIPASTEVWFFEGSPDSVFIMTSNVVSCELVDACDGGHSRRLAIPDFAWRELLLDSEEATEFLANAVGLNGNTVLA